MKRFRWKLQRVLDIKTHTERALRQELFRLAQSIAQVREQILERRTVLRTLLEDLASRGLADRLADLEVVMRFAEVERAHLRRLQDRLEGLERERDARRQEFLEVRAACKTLKRLREQARAEYLREVGIREQLALDEGAHLDFARRRAAPLAAVQP